MLKIIVIVLLILTIRVYAYQDDIKEYLQRKREEKNGK